jgi:integrase
MGAFARRSVAAPFRGLVLELLREDPRLHSGVILQRACEAGYTGGRTALYSLVDRCRSAAAALKPADVAELAPAAAPTIDLAQQLTELRRMIGNLARPSEGAGAPAPAPAASLPPITVREIFDAYEAHRRADHSWVVIRDRLRPLVRNLGHLPAMALTPKVWAEHVARRRREPLVYRTRIEAPGIVTAKFPSDGTIILEASRAKTMLRWASSPDQMLIPANPLAGLKTRKQRHRETSLSEGDIGKVLAAASPTLRAFVLCCVDAGLRFNECRHLRRDWIRQKGVVAIPWEITKSKKSRLVVLTPRALQAIREMPEETRRLPQVFANPKTGLLYSVTTFWNGFRAAVEKAGIDHRVAPGDEQVRIHDLRHTAASAAIRRGAPITAVQQMLGHANLSTTSMYLHADETDAIDLARLMHEGADRERTAGVA